MADITGYYEKIQDEETEFKAAVGEKVMEKIGATINKALTDGAELPVGSVQMSMLTEAQFLAVMGSKWVLCDGQDVTGSLYASVVSSNVPDQRGRYLRMKDNGRGLDPAGDNALGTNQISRIKDHAHFMSTSFIGAKDYSSSKIADPDNQKFTALGESLENILTVNILSQGGNESRPETVTVNFFIKIN